jgi:hypothetical protein
MGLESLLARLEEDQIPATPKDEVQPLEHLEHQRTREVFQEKPLQNKPGTPDTPRTPEIQQGWPDISKPDPAALAHPLMPGVSAEFAARLSAEDLDDIKAGDIPVKTVQAFEAAAIAREAEDLKEFFEEHAGILEYDAGLPRAEAQLKAAKLTATLAKRYGYGWASPVRGAQGIPRVAAAVDRRSR